MFANSPPLCEEDPPSPFAGGLDAAEGLPATSSIFERLAAQLGGAPPPPQPNSQAGPWQPVILWQCTADASICSFWFPTCR